MKIVVPYLLISLLLIRALLCGKAATHPNLSVQHTAAEYKWIKVLDKGPWKESYNFQLFSHHDTLWAFHFDGVWFSANGRSWIKSSLPNVIDNLAFLNYVSFNNSILGLGRFTGNIEQYSLQSTIYRTHDLKGWEILANPSTLPRRFFYRPFVFQNKLWFVGGEDSKTQFADIWNSPDGIVWTKVKDNLSFGKRSRSQVVMLGNKLYLLNNDVWSSEDGLHWKQETGAIINGVEIFGYTAVVLDGQIWLLGCNRNGQFSSQVLVSSDGRTWWEQKAPWSPRGGIAACVHQGKIYMTGGKYGGFDGDQTKFIYSNDVWVLERKSQTND
ncbi:hypothetical protein HNV11_08685 [Spirosoma taeanense]|uniref:DUF6242 domain-containing protein n=1 Tax=Spirosoma taeanense TaxID=2735870 RepID=A0A6M5Y8E6_9BACT|nr:kelch repeat-containing protein [Spirosoma taeanense]QJW89453.1 hypothetical protein HNV11_08685 [Spirosoma taeanense]